MCLSLGYRALFSPDLNINNGPQNRKLDYATLFLDRFVAEYQSFYQGIMTFNVHALLHLVEAVRQHGTVDRFSTYPYLNTIRMLKF